MLAFNKDQKWNTQIQRLGAHTFKCPQTETQCLFFKAMEARQPWWKKQIYERTDGHI